MRQFEVGDKVASRRCGQRDDFIGKIVFKGMNGKGEAFYHVMDSNGNQWHRDESDLSTLYGNDNAATTQVGAA